MPDTHTRWAKNYLVDHPTTVAVRLGHGYGYDFTTHTSHAWVDTVMDDGQHLSTSGEPLPILPHDVQESIKQGIHLGLWVDIPRESESPP
jgi:hypothetical protein